MTTPWQDQRARERFCARFGHTVPGFQYVGVLHDRCACCGKPVTDLTLPTEETE